MQSFPLAKLINTHNSIPYTHIYIHNAVKWRCAICIRVFWPHLFVERDREREREHITTMVHNNKMLGSLGFGDSRDLFLTICDCNQNMNDYYDNRNNGNCSDIVAPNGRTNGRSVSVLRWATDKHCAHSIFWRQQQNQCLLCFTKWMLRFTCFFSLLLLLSNRKSNGIHPVTRKSGTFKLNRF